MTGFGSSAIADINARAFTRLFVDAVWITDKTGLMSSRAAVRPCRMGWSAPSGSWERGQGRPRRRSSPHLTRKRPSVGGPPLERPPLGRKTTPSLDSVRGIQALLRVPFDLNPIPFVAQTHETNLMRIPTRTFGTWSAVLLLSAILIAAPNSQSTKVNVTGPQNATGPLACADSLKDQATPGCLQASSTATAAPGTRGASQVPAGQR